MEFNYNKETGRFTTVEEIAKHEIDFVEFYKHSFAKDSVIKYDRGFKLSAPTIKNILSKSDFQTKLEELGYQLSYTGQAHALIVYRYKKGNYVDWARVTSTPITQFGMLREFSFETQDFITASVGQENKRFKLYGTFKYDENDKVIKTVGYTDESGQYVQTDLIEYDTKEIPAVIMYNNSLRTPDLSVESSAMVKQLAEFVNKIPKEFEKGKAIFAFNNLINSETTSKEFVKKIIKEGGDAFDTKDPDNIVANSIAPFTAGMASIDTIMRLYGFYDSRIKELSFQFRDHGEDSRKSEYDLTLFNQKAHEYMAWKIDFRQRQLQRFIDLLARITKTKTATIKLNITEFEVNRIANLKAITDLKVAQASQAKGIAEKNLKEASFLQNKIDTPSTTTGNVNTDIDTTTVAKADSGIDTTSPTEEVLPQEVK